MKELHDLGITGGQVYIDGKFSAKNLYIQGDKISRISEDVLDCRDIYDAKGKKVIPGLIDPHVHFALDTGNNVSKDDFYTGSVSAAYGGITTFIDFLDPVSNAKDLEKALKKRKVQAKDSVVDYSFHATVANPVGQVVEISASMKKLGMASVKLFTTYSESGRRTYDREILEFLKISGEQGFTVMAHIENDDIVGIKERHLVSDLPRARSEAAEITEARKLVSFAEKENGNLYMVHVSSGNTLKTLMERYPGLICKNVHLESCPHYFVFTEKKYNEKNGHLFTMIPPLRSRDSSEMLKEQIDCIETIGTDHCSYMKADKDHRLLKDIPMGIGSVENSFRVMYTLAGEKIIEKMSLNPAEIFGLYPQKGVLKKGSDADITIFDDRAQYVLKKDHSACDYSVYEGMKVKCRIESTISRGKFVIRNGRFEERSGKCLL